MLKTNINNVENKYEKYWKLIKIMLKTNINNIENKYE